MGSGHPRKRKFFSAEMQFLMNHICFISSLRFQLLEHRAAILLKKKDVESITKDSEKRGHSETSPVVLQEGEKSEDSNANESHLAAEPNPPQLNSGINQRPKRVTKPPERYGFEDMTAYALHAAEEIDSNEPATYKEAINHPEAEIGC